MSFDRVGALNNIDNVRVEVSIRGYERGAIRYTSDTGNVETYLKGSYNCDNNQVTLTLNNIDPSTSSNILSIEYGCSTSTLVGYKLIIYN